MKAKLDQRAAKIVAEILDLVSNAANDLARVELTPHYLEPGAVQQGLNWIRSTAEDDLVDVFAQYLIFRVREDLRILDDEVRKH